MNTSCRIMVLGREIPVRTTARPELVEKIESLVNERLAAAGATLTLPDPQLMSVLALLNMAEEIVSLRELLKQSEADTAKLTDLVALLDANLAACPR